MTGGGAPKESASDALARVLARMDTSAAEDTTLATSILEARARKLAKPHDAVDGTPTDDEIDILVFLVGEERLGIPLSSIVAIARAGTVTPLPRAIAPVYGVTAWRGRPLTVLTVGGSGSPNEGDSRMIVLGDGRRALVGLRVDAADDTRTVRRSALTTSEGGARSQYAIGMTSDAVLVLDPEILIHSARPEL